MTSFNSVATLRKHRNKLYNKWMPPAHPVNIKRICVADVSLDGLEDGYKKQSVFCRRQFERPTRCMIKLPFNIYYRFGGTGWKFMEIRRRRRNMGILVWGAPKYEMEERRLSIDLADNRKRPGESCKYPFQSVPNTSSPGTVEKKSISML